MAHRHDIALADEDVRLAEGDLAVDHLRGARDDEQRVAILLDLGILMRLAGILDGELMQVAAAPARVRSKPVEGSHRPIQTMCRPARPGAGLFDRDVAKPAALRIDAGGNQTRLRGWRTNA